MAREETAQREIVVIGASAGGVEALVSLVAGLPADLPLALCVVLHLPATRPSALPALLARAGPLPVAWAEEGAPLVPGRILVAPPDRHLLIRPGSVALTHGPRENHMRPAADPLFRSAARSYGARVIGVVLSGTLDDGALGLRAIAARGGVTVVQDPAEALFDGMPRAALRQGRSDYTLPVADIASLLVQLAGAGGQGTSIGPSGTGRGGTTMEARDDEELARALIQRDMAAQARDERSAATTVYACPECGGTLWQVDYEGLTRFQCHVGHSYGTQVRLGQMAEDLEAALWRAVRLLEEKATLTRQVAGRLRVRGEVEAMAVVDEQATLDDQHARAIRETLLENLSTPAMQALVVAEAWERAMDGRDDTL